MGSCEIFIEERGRYVVALDIISFTDLKIL